MVQQHDNFVVHWLNNKELHFTKQAEMLLHEMNKKCTTIPTEHSSSDTYETEQTTTETTTTEDEDQSDRTSSNSKTKSKVLQLNYTIRF